MSSSKDTMEEKERQLASWSDLQSNRPLPVRFELYASKRTSQALCPCLVLQHRNVEVIRILDPEHQQPYISLDSIFILAGKSVPLGLLECDLHREAGDYDLTLAGLEPREALWAPLKVARRIAEDLNLLQPLSLLLDWDNRHIWSLDEGEEGIMHNWRASGLDVASYSTGTLMQEEISHITQQPKGNMFRTLVSESQRRDTLQRSATLAQLGAHTSQESIKRFEEKMLRWTVLSHETLIYSRNRAELPSSYEEDDESEHNDPSITNADMLLLLKDLMQGLATDTTFAPVSLKMEEIHSSSRHPKSKSSSPQDRYRDARIVMTLLHHYWSLYMRIISDQAIHTTKVESQPFSQLTSGANDEDGKDREDIKECLRRLEISSRRTEWAIGEMMREPSRRFNYKHEQSDSTWYGQLPIIGMTDARLLIALIIGILLGSAATSRM